MIRKLLSTTCAGALAWGVIALPASAQIDEIIVTATKREASIQDVPIAVTALSAAQLEKAGFTDIRDIQNLVPGFNLNSSQTESQGTTLRIRGVGTTGNNIGLESAVGVFLDGVYLSRPGVALGDLPDIEQVEVLRGPQGTLFGRNTSAGALNVKTRRPNLNEIEAFGNVSAGNLSLFNVQASASYPVIQDQLAFRVSGAYRDRDGYLESAFNGSESYTRDRYVLRGQMLWEPTENINFRLIGDYADAEEECCDAVIIRESDAAPALAARNGGDDGVFLSGPPAVKGRVSNSEGFENPYEQWGISGEFNWDFGFGNMKYIGSYRDFRAESIQSEFVGLDVYSVPFSFDEIKTQSHEVQFQGNWRRLDWLFGFYYSDEEIEEQANLTLGDDFALNFNGIFADGVFGGAIAAAALGANAGDPLNVGVGTVGGVGIAAATPGADVLTALAGGINPAGSFALNKYTQEGESISVYTHNTLSLTEKLDLVVGLRFSREEKDGAFEQLDANSPACGAVAANAGQIATALATSGNPAAAAAAADIAGAATVITCFPFSTQAGLIPGLTPEEFSDQFTDDELTGTGKLVYEITPDINAFFSFAHGFKAGGFNLDSTAAIGGSDPTFDSEEVDAYELGLKADLIPGRLRTNVTLFRQRMDNFQVLEFTGTQFVTFNVDKASSDGVEVEIFGTPIDGLNLNLAVTYADARYPDDCTPTPGGTAVPDSLCGSQLTNAPLWTGVLGGNWQQDIPGTNFDYFVNANWILSSERRTSTNTFLVDDVQPGYGKVNLRVGLGDIDGRWSVEGWAQNLFDIQTRNTTFNTPLRADSRGAFIEEPRTWGFTIRARY